MTPPVLWTPPDSLLQRCALGAYRRERGFDTYDELWKWSVTDLEGFWGSIWDRYGLGERGAVLASEEMPGAQWFPGTLVNYAEQVFREKSGLAIIAGGEDRDDVEWSWDELRELTRADRHRPAGAGRRARRPRGRLHAEHPGDGGGVPRLRVARRGVVVVFARLRATQRGRSLRADRAEGAARGAHATATTGASSTEPRRSTRSPRRWTRARSSSARTRGTRSRPSTEAPLQFERVAFDHPLWVLYSSGTTGLPKAIVQSQGGILLEHLKMLYLHVDAQPGDRLFWFTTTGWMMWNFIVSGLLTEATILLYDGSPGYPDMDVLWDFAARTGMTTFGTSASYIGACMKAGVEPAAGRDLSALKGVGSTGSPLSPEGFRWVYEHVGQDTWLFSTSGGTDLCTAFVGGVPELPVYEGELQARALGAAIESWDPDGKPHIGEVGELVLTRPMPSMPIYFWGDDDGSRYREAYFETYPGIWRHGDWIEITDRGTAIISGRSDATINRGGIRMGTAEIYRAVLTVDAITDALVVDVPVEGEDAWMPLFVVLREGAALTDEVIAEIRKRVREDCSPRHVPNEVIAVDAVPRTLSGKVLELPVKRILMGTPPEKAAARDSLANPEALDAFVALAAQRGG